MDVLRLGTPLGALSGLGTCVTDRYHDARGTPPSAVGLTMSERRYRAVMKVCSGRSRFCRQSEIDRNRDSHRVHPIGMWAVRFAGRVAPVLLCALVAVVMAYGSDPGGVHLWAMPVIVALPLLAWAILAPTVLIGYVGGIVALPCVVGWLLVLDRADAVGTRSTAGGLLRWYPVVAGVVVIVALAVTYTLRRRTLAGRLRIVTVVRILFGTAVLLASFIFYFMLQPQPLQEAGSYVSSAVSTRDGYPTMIV
jgi:hypothetical protein